MKTMGIKADTERIERLNYDLQNKKLETEKEDAAKKLAALGTAYDTADHSKRQEIIESIQRECETLKKTATAEPKIITSKALMQKQFQARQWIIENLIGHGLSILSGASKIGKSWLLFALAEAASEGGKFLDHYMVNKTSVLHLSLEDIADRIKERRVILARKQGGFSGNDNLFIATEWEGGTEGLEAYLRAHNEIGFVIIDTLGQFMPDIEDMNGYAPTVKALSMIKKVADTLGIAILVVHHAKKGGADQGDWMDQSLGSQGIVASADTIILLRRDIDKTGERKNTGKLYATGRGIKDTFHNVEYSPGFGMWAVIDKKKLETPGKGKDTENRPGTSWALGEDIGNPLSQEWK
ncbi:MAG: helicase RepA family protein [Treponema sp.]|jgi:hypothetical protein|nr:helicase RepA family protein [Treponema sp.]